MKFSRSHVEAWFECPRKRFLNYHLNGKGVVPSGSKGVGLEFGSFVHELIEARFKAQPYDETINKYKETLSEADLYFGEALVRGWFKARWPSISEHYELVSSEKEFSLLLPNDLTFMMKIDGVLKRKSDGKLAALEFKTSSQPSSRMLESYKYDTQTLAHCYGVEKEFGECSLVMIEVLHKGPVRNNINYSPMASGYVNMRYEVQGDNSIPQYSYSDTPQRAANWQRFDCWSWRFDQPNWMSNAEYWVEHEMSMPRLQECFSSTEIFRDLSDVDDWLTQTLFTEAKIQNSLSILEGHPEQLPELFPARKNRHCYLGRYWWGCDYLPICYGEICQSSAISSGMFKEREPHHEGEF